MSKTLAWLLVGSVVLAIAGLATSANGSINMTRAEQSMISASGAAYAEILDYEAPESVQRDLRDARQELDSAKRQESIGLVLLIAGGVGAVIATAIAVSRRRSANAQAS